MKILEGLYILAGRHLTHIKFSLFSSIKIVFIVKWGIITQKKTYTSVQFGEKKCIFPKFYNHVLSSYLMKKKKCSRNVKDVMRQHFQSNDGTTFDTE